MYILLALITACAFGIIVHFVMIPHHDLRGVAVAPAVATATAGAVYTIGQWAGLAENSPRLWLLSLGAAAALSVAWTLVLTLMRVRGDSERRAALGI